MLGRGNAGPEVKQLQELLNNNGFSLETDGIFGPKTEAALKEFQSRQGLSMVDGVVGPETYGAMDKVAAVNGAGDGAAAENAVAAKLNGAGDGAKAENLAAERAKESPEPTFPSKLQEILDQLVPNAGVMV